MDHTASSLTAFVCVMLAAVSAQGREIVRYSRATDGSRVFTPIGDEYLYPAAGFRAYDNWRTATEGGRSNQSRGFYIGGTNEIADDLVLETSGPSLLSDAGFSISNRSSTHQLASFRLTIRWYDEQRTLLGYDTFRPLPIDANSGVSYFSDGGFYTGFGMIIPTHAIMSIQISELVGFDPSEIGFRFAGPRTNGYSTQFSYDFTTGQSFSFDGSDQSNMRFFVDTVNVPLPSTTLACTAMSILFFRRRR